MAATAEKILSSLYKFLKTTDLKLLVSIQTIKRLNDIYKKSYANSKTEAELLEKFSDFSDALKKSPAAICEIKKQFSKKLALQSSILTECFIAQTLAEALQLDKFADIDNSNAELPVQISNLLFQQKNKKDGASFRYIYYGEKYDKVLVQCGDSSTIDAVFIKEKIGVRIEFKEEIAKLSEQDIPSYDEKGKLVLDEDFINKYPYYVPFVEIFNRKTDMFKMIGHNFSLVDFINKENSSDIINNILDLKSIDLYILLKKNSLVPIIASELADNVTFAASEIRTAGRNSKKLWSRKFAEEEISRLGGKIADGQVTIPFQEKLYSTGRGSDVVTRCKLNSFLFVRIEDVKRDGDILKFAFEDIRQLKPSISLHLSPL